MTSGPRVGLVLGAGGPVGHAWHCGVLRALAEALPWDPRDARLVVGTSAGAQVGALLRAGMHPRDLAARVAGEALSPEGAAIAAHFVRPRRWTLEAPSRRGPAAPEYLLSALRRPWRARPGRLAAALLPPGRAVTAPQAEGLRRLFGHAWPDRDLWIPAVDVATGAVVAFGHPRAPRADVGTAVASSGAVPGVCKPIEHGARRYVDGGMASPTHLPLLDDRHDLDLVIVSSPLSRLAPMRLLLRNELRGLRRRGVPLAVLEPAGAAAAAMGWNPMDPDRGPAVAEAAHRAMGQAIDRHPALRALR